MLQITDVTQYDVNVKLRSFRVTTTEKALPRLHHMEIAEADSNLAIKEALDCQSLRTALVDDDRLCA